MIHHVKVHRASTALTEQALATKSVKAYLTNAPGPLSGSRASIFGWKNSISEIPATMAPG